MKSDGNGGYNIQKGTFALLTIIIALISCISTVVAFGVTIKSDVNYLKDQYQKAGDRHPLVIAEINEKIDLLENCNLINQEKILSIHDDINEIKLDVKTLLAK